MPGIVTYAIGVMLSLVAVALWIIMMKQSYRSVPRIGFFGWIAVIGLMICLNNAVSAAMHAALHTFRMPTGTMSPTIIGGDHLVVEKLSFKFRAPQRGDIIVFTTDGIPSLPPDTFYIKRVVGVPGERIRIKPPNLIVNDHVVIDPPVFRRISSAEPSFTGYQLAMANALLSKPTDEIRLGKDEYLVFGDNPRNSRDSRYWGPVPRKNIVGKAPRIYWPLNRIGQSLGRE